MQLYNYTQFIDIWPALTASVWLNLIGFCITWTVSNKTEWLNKTKRGRRANTGLHWKINDIRSQRVTQIRARLYRVLIIEKIFITCLRRYIRRRENTRFIASVILNIMEIITLTSELRWCMSQIKTLSQTEQSIKTVFTTA